MEKRSNVYITTTIPYVNADPHIGFALEAVQADALARYFRLVGCDVFFNQGADEHGQKVWEKAVEEGGDAQRYVDRYAEKVKALRETLNLSNDAFVRTTDPTHKAAAQELWHRCDAAGDIYKKKYKGLYCVGCEKFLSKRDLVDGKCPLHPGQEPVELEEENYFFKLTNYQQYLEKYLESDDVIVPKHRLEEARQFVQNGLEDFSISREQEKLPWGVPVPGDSGQVMYVWFDALTNYISTLGWPDDKEGTYEKFWENGRTIQLAGKDQIRFQSIMWQAMLKSAGLPPTDQVFYHGFITSGGQRMSKSLGNVIAPGELVKRYGVDATRYLLLRHVHPTDDTDVTWERLDEWYTADLVNGLGNLVSRTVKMAAAYNAWPKVFPEKDWLVQHSYAAKYLEAFEFSKALDEIWGRIGRLDAEIQKTKPFQVVKNDPEKAKEEVQFLLNEVYRIGWELQPILVDTAEKVIVSLEKREVPENLFPRLR